ncbi:MAG: hypothetical protein JW986_09435 [Methanotrichaceae archaeon]|nr:hypothetical protein [Methanotrichaceae archaeon]
MAKEDVGKADERSAPHLHLRVEAKYIPNYWMNLEVPASLTLHRLDEFLRDTWLECCGHLSEFSIKGENYLSEKIEPGDKGMKYPLRDLLSVGMKADYIYDFGSSTELTIKVLSSRDIIPRKKPVRVLASNLPPDIRCSCGEPAEYICAACDEGAWLCEKCASSHECGDECLLPVVNSPRTGVCGYDGSGGFL